MESITLLWISETRRRS